MTNTGTALTKVNLDPVQRPGFMTRAGFLSSYSHYDDTAPILRGAFITIFMIGVDPGPPLPGATMIQPPPADYKTVRERTDALVNQAASCMGCHTNVINPPGYVMENYDAHRRVADGRQARQRRNRPGRHGQLRRQQHARISTTPRS